MGVRQKLVRMTSSIDLTPNMNTEEIEQYTRSLLSDLFYHMARHIMDCNSAIKVSELNKITLEYEQDHWDGRFILTLEKEQ